MHQKPSHLVRKPSVRCPLTRRFHLPFATRRNPSNHTRNAPQGKTVKSIHIPTVPSMLRLDQTDSSISHIVLGRKRVDIKKGVVPGIDHEERHLDLRQPANANVALIVVKSVFEPVNGADVVIVNLANRGRVAHPVNLKLLGKGLPKLGPLLLSLWDDALEKVCRVYLPRKLVSVNDAVVTRRHARDRPPQDAVPGSVVSKLSQQLRHDVASQARTRHVHPPAGIPLVHLLRQLPHVIREPHVVPPRAKVLLA
mmetsp:Transcript_51900/g.129133  ORF Transcript_51900/g.129133 Transcript_51900/m.129133 type:complete len:253 (+) Transcript_51900:620-1378(+)